MNGLLDATRPDPFLEPFHIGLIGSGNSAPFHSEDAIVRLMNALMIETTDK